MGSAAPLVKAALLADLQALYTVPIPDEVAHQRTILDAARTALTANRAFVASTPTAAQVSAQVKALTRQVNALIRLQLHDLSGTD